MALLPKYQKTGIKVRQPNNIDFAAAREQARFGQVLSQQLDRMGEFAFKEASLQAEERGRERVREQGAINTLKQLEAKGGPYTIAERSAFEAANRVAVVEIETAARSDMRTLITQADESNMAMSVFAEKMSDIRDGYTASLQVVDPVMAGVLGARLQEDSVSFDNRYAEIVQRKAKAAWAANTEVILNEGVQKIMDAALQEGSDVKDENGQNPIEKAAADLLATAQTRGVNQKKAQKLVDKAINSALRENVMFRFNNAAGIPEKQAIIAELEQSDTFAGMNYEQSFNFRNRLSQSVDREIANFKTEWLSSADDALVVLQHTGSLPEDFETDEEALSIYFQNDEDALDIALRTIEFAKEDVVTYGSLSSMSPDEATVALGGMIDDLNEAKDRAESGEEIAALQARATNFQNALADRDDKIRTDPAQYVIETNLEAQKAANKAMMALSVGDVETLGTELNVLAGLVNTAYDKIGVPGTDRRIMSKDIAANMIIAIERIDTDFEVAIIKQVQDAFGPMAPQFIHEMREAGLKNEYVEALHLNDAGTHNLLATIAPIDITTITPKTTDKNTVDDKIEELTENYDAASSRGRGNIAIDDLNNQMMVVKKLAYYFIKEGEEPLKAAELAVKKIIPEYNNVAILNGGKNGQFVVPTTLNADRMQLFAKGILKPSKLEELGVVALDVSIAGPEEDQRISYAALAKNGVWLNNNTGDGIVLHYEIDDRTLIQATYEDGSAVDIKFKDLPGVAGPQKTTARQIIDVTKFAIPGGPKVAEVLAEIAGEEYGTAVPLAAEDASKQAELQTSKADQMTSLLEPIFESDQGTQAQKDEYRGYIMTWMRDPARAADDVLPYEDWLKTQE